ncbi:hypothetical protein ALI144C_12830 [Actinosynnema sp. ALI-1.44]|uniref:Rv3235 family protein n=1 Tax=Actinosynnema sp. ALI-1.44 TaxID=1933779 RepID=UPI00097C3776|nr:Rv3235 family protein [Actinosynnema sp. ALI-1.44]ONI85975.1 hypothetical protein ALI144C_12830 [Actinosynnema sp. ALI-1.44]
MTTPTLRPLTTYEPIDGQILIPATRQPEPAAQAHELPVTADNARFTLIATKILEVLDGRRPPGHLETLVAPPVHRATLTRLRTRPPVGIRYQLSSIHSCRPAVDAVETCGLVETTRHGTRARRAEALACRFEFRKGSWICVYFRIIHC